MSEKGYKVLIVEDEELEIDGIRYLLENSKYNFSKILSAKSGNKAIDIFEENNPEIIFMDIRIPEKDGLLVSEKILKERPDTKIIIISGYNEFDFAKKALELKIFGYLLKPLKTKEFLAILQKAINRIKLEEKIDRQNKKLKKRLQESMPALRKDFIRNLASGSKLKSNEIKSKSLLLDLKIDCFCIMLLSIYNFSELAYKLDEEDIQLLKFKIINLIEGIINGYRDSICFELIENKFLIFLTINKHAGPLQKYRFCLNIAEEIQNKLKEYLELNSNIGIGSYYNSLELTHSSYIEAEEALRQKAHLGRNSIIYIKDIKTKIEPKSMIASELGNELIEDFKYMNIQKLISKKKSLFESFLNDEASLSLIKQKILEIIILISNSIEFEDKIKSGYRITTKYFSKVIQSQDIDESDSYFSSFLTEFKDFSDQVLDSKNKGITNQALDYINHNYMKDITLEKISGYLYLSPSYFSYLFKKEHNINYNTYLTDFRIKKAKILLRDIRKRVNEVSKEVGFKDLSYFCKVFKEQTGITPNEYKNSNISLDSKSPEH